jgi:competence protein ComEC
MGIDRVFENSKSAWLAERPQWALWLPVCVGTGIAVYFALPVEPPSLMGILVVVFGALVLVGAKTDILRVGCVAATFIAVGFASAQWRAENVNAPVITKRTKPVRLVGTVERTEIAVNGGRVVLSELDIPHLQHAQTPAKIRLSVRGNTRQFGHLLPGDRVALTAVLRPPPPPTMPGAFDFQRRAWFLGIGAYGFVLGDINKHTSTARDPPTALKVLKRKIETVRLEISIRVHDLAGGDAGAVAAALLTGHRSYIREEVLQAMRDAGIAHLLAISGLHIGLVAGIVFTGARLAAAAVPFVGLRLNGKKLGAALAIPAALAYAVLAGFTVPTERAFLMTGLMLAGVLIDRRALSMRSVCWAATVVLLFRPESLVGPGFQMSFAAVTALIATYAYMSRRQRARGRDNDTHITGRLWKTSGRYVLGVLVTSIVASAATAPFAIYHFQHAAAFGLIANALAVPLAAFWVMPAGIVSMMTMPFGLDAVPVRVMCAGIELILSSATYLAALPGAAVDIAAPPLWSLCVITIAGLWLSLWKGRWRLYTLPVLVVGLCGPAFAPHPDIIIDGDARIIAVRQAHNAFLTSTNRAARFESANWQQRLGLSEKPFAWRRSAEQAQGRLRCDGDGCTLDIAHKLIAISLNETTHEDDCRQSWMLLATVPVRGHCRPPWGIIDRFDLWRYGTHAITFTADGPIVRTVNGERGRRPWVIAPE